MNGRERRDPDEDGGDRGLLWKLPVVSTKELGKIGPGFGFGAGCGFGFGIGLLGGNYSLLSSIYLPEIYSV